jgi:hypothetical protein
LEHGVRHLLAGINGRIEGGRIVFSRETRKRQLFELDPIEATQDPKKTRLNHRLQEDTSTVREMKLAIRPRDVNVAKLTSIPEDAEESVSEQSVESEREEAQPLHAALKEVSGSECLGELEQEEATHLHAAPKRAENTQGKDEIGRREVKSADGDKSEHAVVEKGEITRADSKSTVAADGLELKATKADDARVRVEMWDSELGNVMGIGESEELTQAAEAIRVFCLRWWRRRVTRSFFCWLHQKADYQGVGLDDMSHVVELVQLNTPGQPEKNYRWAQLGRAVCCDWWSERDARHYKDLRSAREAVERSSRATWFEWTDGSTPVHWKWPTWYQPAARDGLPVWFKEAPKQWV